MENLYTPILCVIQHTAKCFHHAQLPQHVLSPNRSPCFIRIAVHSFGKCCWPLVAKISPSLDTGHHRSKRDERRIQQTGFTGVKDSGDSCEGFRVLQVGGLIGLHAQWGKKKAQHLRGANQQAFQYLQVLRGCPNLHVFFVFKSGLLSWKPSTNPLAGSRMKPSVSRLESKYLSLWRKPWAYCWEPVQNSCLNCIFDLQNLYVGTVFGKPGIPWCCLFWCGPYKIVGTFRVCKQKT